MIGSSVVVNVERRICGREGNPGRVRTERCSPPDSEGGSSWEEMRARGSEESEEEDEEEEGEAPRKRGKRDEAVRAVRLSCFLSCTWIAGQ